MTRIICGVDISSVSLAARIGRSGVAASFANTAEGIAELAAFCHANHVELIAMEATGGYEQRAFALLWEQALPVAILNPRAVRRFAEAMGLPDMGLPEKTDAIDAGLIAWFAEIKHSAPQAPASDSQQRLRALVTRLRQLTVVRTAQRNQRRLVVEPAVLDWIDQMLALVRMLALVKEQTEQLEISIAALIAADPLWQHLDPVLRSIKGVADRTVARLMAEMPELGTLSNKAISKLAGVAPLARDSGQHQGRRAVRGGRAPVREILFIVASVVGRYEPDFIAFRQRLSDAGKPRKVIRIALAHKLLVRLNAKAREVRQQLCVASSAPHDMLAETA